MTDSRDRAERHSGGDAFAGLEATELAPGVWWVPIELVAQHVVGRGSTEVIRECPACKGRWARDRVQGLTACPDCAYDGSAPAGEYTP